MDRGSRSLAESNSATGRSPYICVHVSLKGRMASKGGLIEDVRTYVARQTATDQETFLLQEVLRLEGDAADPVIVAAARLHIPGGNFWRLRDLSPAQYSTVVRLTGESLFRRSADVAAAFGLFFNARDGMVERG